MTCAPCPVGFDAKPVNNMCMDTNGCKDANGKDSCDTKLQSCKDVKARLSSYPTRRYVYPLKPHLRHICATFAVGAYYILSMPGF